MLKTLIELMYVLTLDDFQLPTDPAPPEVIQLQKAEVVEEQARKTSNEETYSAYREHIWALRQANFDKADNMILSLASALLAFSLAFLKGIVHQEQYGGIIWLRTSWLFLAIAIVICFVSFFFSRRAMDWQLKRAEEFYINDRDDAFKAKNVNSVVTEGCNLVAAIFFLAGIGLTIYSVSANLGAATMKKDASTSKPSLNSDDSRSRQPYVKGSTPPSPPPKKSGAGIDRPTPQTEGATPPEPPPKK